jgi:hypothetical protein
MEDDLDYAARFRRPADPAPTAGLPVVPADQDAPAAFGTDVGLGDGHLSTLARATITKDSLGGDPRGAPHKGAFHFQGTPPVSTTRCSSQVVRSRSE